MNLMPRSSLTVFFGTLVVLPAVAVGERAGHAADSAARPNVVFIMADDLGYGDLSCYGATAFSTPHCDRLAREGRRFTDAHTPAGSCSPTRFGLLTGGYPWRENRVPGALNAGESYKLRDGEPTLGSLLKSAGYATACIGKWHLGVQRQKPVDWNAPLAPGPNTAGFDYYFGVINSHNQAPFVLVENDKILGREPGERIAIGGERLQTEGRRLRDENALEAMQAAKAVAFIEQNQGRPFFLYYPTAAIHDPYTPGKAWQGTSQAGVYGDYAQEFDWAVGEVLAALDRHQLADKTIVVVTSDNGAQQGRASSYGHKCNGDLRGFKGTAWEGGHRVPFIVRWPGKVPAGTKSDETICHVDFMATVCAALDIELPSHAGPDSWNVLGAWLGDKTDQPLKEATVCVGKNSMVFSIRHGEWKLLANANDKYVADKPLAELKDTRDPIAEPQLFNLAVDPAEQYNLAATTPEKFEALAALLAKYRDQGHSRPGWKSDP